MDTFLQAGFRFKRTLTLAVLKSIRRSIVATISKWAPVPLSRTSMTTRFVVYDNGYIDDPYTIEQLNAPSMVVARIVPLVDEFYNSKDITIGTNTYQQIKRKTLRVLIVR